jgi:hypothetical protein
MKQPIFSGAWGKCHIQGIAVDEDRGYIYYSFTTKLVKSTLDGKIVGYVDGLMGHLGCIAFNRENGCIYGSLEYKCDAIGQDILKKLGQNTDLDDAFYIAIFDAEKINRMGMDAEKDGIMKTVYLEEVFRDYRGTGFDRWGNTVPHRYGCSGIDGITFGPMFGESPDSKQYLFVSYGVYSDLSRDDNDHQILLCYDTDNWDTYAAPLSQSNMHRNGPSEPTDKLFVFTGNTRYGVQNLEYDPYKQVYFMAVYAGEKNQFPNYHLYAVDAKQPPKIQALRGLSETGKVVSLYLGGQQHQETGIRGWSFPYGSTGLFACGDGRYYISENHVCQSGQCSLIYLYIWDDNEAFVLPD